MELKGKREGRLAGAGVGAAGAGAAGTDATVPSCLLSTLPGQILFLLCGG